MKSKMITLMISVFVVFTQALAAKSHVDIVQVFVDDPNNPTSIMIIGENLLFGKDPLSVTLGGFGALNITGPPATR